MPAPRTRRAPWEDRFSQPTEAEVLAHYPRQLLCCANAARKALQSRLGARESLQWKGIPWRWTFVYTRPNSAFEAYLVPIPAAPRLVLTVPAGEALPYLDRHTPRTIRDAFVSAVRVGPNLWPGWDLTLRAQVDEIAEFLDRVASADFAEASVA